MEGERGREAVTTPKRKASSYCLPAATGTEACPEVSLNVFFNQFKAFQKLPGLATLK